MWPSEEVSRLIHLLWMVNGPLLPVPKLGAQGSKLRESAEEHCTLDVMNPTLCLSVKLFLLLSLPLSVFLFISVFKKG